MIWLASFPRSGNTFFRNVLYEVYGLESSTFHLDIDRPLDKNYEQFPFVKTHLLPDQVMPGEPDIPAVYLVRDGRDALVSLAHHRKDIVEPGSDFTHNLIEAVIARGGSHFGGWSANVKAWTKRADIVIKFEDLIEDPLREIEKLRAIVDLPAPDQSKLPNFQTLKFGQPKYGGGQKKDFDASRNQSHFRKGRIGSHREEMPEMIEQLFWGKHGKMMKALGYVSDIPKPKSSKNILIEGSKYFNQHMDGIGRYIQSLVKFLPILLEDQSQWTVDLLHKNQVIPVYKAQIEREENPQQLILEHDYEQKLLKSKALLKAILPGVIYRPLRNIYVHGPWRRWLKWLRNSVSRRQIDQLKQDLSQIHKTYDLIHAPVPQGIKFAADLGENILTTVHDVTHKVVPQFHTEDNILETEEGMIAIQQTGSHALTVSNATSRDLMKYYGINPDKVHVVHEGIDPDFFHPKWRSKRKPELDKKYQLPNQPYILSLSTLEPRKNIVGTIKAFEKLIKAHPAIDTHLVIAGRKGWKWKEILQQSDHIKERLTFTGYIEEEHLPYLYAHARVFCYPSHYEGFGLPLVEAMGCGTPVIYGQNSAMIEVADRAGIGVSATDTEAMAKAMWSLIDSAELWQKQSHLSRARANELTWLKSALYTLECYDKIINQ